MGGSHHISGFWDISEIWRCSPPQWGGANHSFWGAPPHSGGEFAPNGVEFLGLGGEHFQNFPKSKFRWLPPTVGGSLGGSILTKWGGVGGSKNAIWRRPMDTPTCGVGGASGREDEPRPPERSRVSKQNLGWSQVTLKSNRQTTKQLSVPRTLRDRCIRGRSRSTAPAARTTWGTLCLPPGQEEGAGGPAR